MTRSTGTSAGAAGLRGEGAAHPPRGGDLVHGVGGVLSAAHLKDRGTRPVLAAFKEDGLDAVETGTPRTTENQRGPPDFARRAGTARTGGSDWHGED